MIRDDILGALYANDIERATALVRANSLHPDDLGNVFSHCAQRNYAELLETLLDATTPTQEEVDLSFESVEIAGHPDMVSRLLGMSPSPSSAALTHTLDAIALSLMAARSAPDSMLTPRAELRDAWFDTLHVLLDHGVMCGSLSAETLFRGLTELGRTDLAERFAPHIGPRADALFFAARDHARKTMAALAPVDWSGNEGQAVLCGFVASNDLAGVRAAIAAGARPNEPFHFSMAEGSPMFALGSLPADASADLAQALVDGGADVRRDESVVVSAAANGNSGVLSVLLESRGDPNAAGGQAVVQAARANAADCVRLLLERGADPLSQNGLALMYAKESRLEDIVDLLSDQIVRAGGTVPPDAAAYVFAAEILEDSPGSDFVALWNAWTAFGSERLFPPGLTFSGASEGEICHAEAALGVAFPDDVKALYRRCNGDRTSDGTQPEPWGRGVFFGSRLLSLAEMVEKRDFWRGVRESIKDVPNEEAGGTAAPAGTVKCLYINERWLALTEVNGSHVSVDLDPDTAGVTGQIINSGRDETNKVQFGTSLADFMRRMLRQIARQNYQIRLDEGFTLGTEGSNLSQAVRELIESGSW